MTLRLLLRCPFIVIGALILAFVISPTMGFWFVLVTLAISLVVWLIMRVTVPQYRAAQNTLDKVTLLTREIMWVPAWCAPLHGRMTKLRILPP